MASKKVSDRYWERYYKASLKRVYSRLSGIAEEDLTTAEKQIKAIVEKALVAKLEVMEVMR